MAPRLFASTLTLILISVVALFDLCISSVRFMHKREFIKYAQKIKQSITKSETANACRIFTRH